MSLLLRLPRGNAYNQLVSTRNYTGDVLNFGLAKENYAASHPDKIDRLKFVIVGDDVSVGRAQGSIVGRRGLAGTVLVYKIAGALAGRGASLDEVYNVAQWVSTRLGTIGVGLEHCHASAPVSTSAKLSDQLGSNYRYRERSPQLHTSHRLKSK